MAIDYNQSSTDYNALEHEYGGAGVATYEPGYRLKGEKYRSVNYQYRGGDSYETHQVTAAITGSATATAALLQGQFVTAAITGSATAVTAIIEVAGLTAAITGTATVTAAITSAQFMEAAVTGTGTATAAIVRERPISAAVTGTAAVTAALIEEAIIDAGEAAITATATVTADIDSVMIEADITATATVVLASYIHKVPQPELTLSVNDIIGSSNVEEQQDTLTLLVGV